MHHETELISTIAAGFATALVLGLLAHRLRLPVMVGYLFAGMLVGPFTPGYVADLDLAPQLAEIGVILLMFGVGNHFSLRDLLSVRAIALPGAIGQVIVATSLGVLLAWVWGWNFGAGMVFGLSLSVASTVVLLRALEQTDRLHSRPGRVAVGWLVVEDLLMVVALVVIPGISGLLGGETSGDGSLAISLVVTFAKVAAFVALMLVAGVRVVPWLLQAVERTGSRELFVLAVLAIALGIAYGAAEYFEVSFALGAFLAGVVIAESEFSHRAAEEALPLREAFSVLFFVSVGMLIEPSAVIDEIGLVAGALLIVLIGKSVAAMVIVRLLGGGWRTALTVAAGLSQVGEFSFILAEMGMDLDLLPEEGQTAILAAALLSITLNPLLFGLIDPIRRLLGGPPPARPAAQPGS